MAITIRGIRITSLSVERQEEGLDKISADYQLISSADKVLAKESVTSKPSYGGTAFVPSAPTMKLLADAVSAYRKEVEMSLGLESE